MKSRSKAPADAGLKASTSRVKRFLRAWDACGYPDDRGNTAERMDKVLKCYELLTVMGDWDPDTEPLNFDVEIRDDLPEGLEPPR